MTKPRPYGHYFILEKIAQGGMAEIFKGLTYDFSGLKKFIVIKRILPHIAANDDFIRMLIDEAKIAVRLSHGNIAQTYDLGKVAEDYFIVMEYVEGPTLSQIFKKAVALEKPLPIPMVAYVVGEICNGLDYIHRRTDDTGNPLGIVHCDISPQNIIVSPAGTVKIVDFGVAKAVSKISEKEKGVLKGKFAYMSPEQTKSHPVAAASDIFSTGIVLWELLTSRRLFKKKANTDTIKAVQSMEVHGPSSFREEVTQDLDKIVLTALNRDSAKRYSSAADLALALTKFNLKHFPEFKRSQLKEILGEYFTGAKGESDLGQEKTHYDEITIHEEGEGNKTAKLKDAAKEDTLIVDPEELQFQSIFEDIEMDEVSEVTAAISLNPENEVEEELTRDFIEKKSGSEAKETAKPLSKWVTQLKDRLLKPSDKS